MTTSIPAPVMQNSPKSSWFSGCVITALVILFVILGIYNFVSGLIIAYVFSAAGMFSPVSIAIVLIIAVECFIYFFLVFRVKRQHWLISLTLVALVWFILPLLLNLLINISTARVRNDGYSMAVTLPNGSYILVDRLAYQQNDLQRGDIVIFGLPLDPEHDLIKRIIGLPGEVVSINDGQVLINGSSINEPYVSEKATYAGEWIVPEGEYFVLGDNRPDSSDSHSWDLYLAKILLEKQFGFTFLLPILGKLLMSIFPNKGSCNNTPPNTACTGPRKSIGAGRAGNARTFGLLASAVKTFH